MFKFLPKQMIFCATTIELSKPNMAFLSEQGWVDCCSTGTIITER